MSQKIQLVYLLTKYIKYGSCDAAVSTSHISLLSEEHEGQNMFILTQQVLLYKNVAI
jgi:hypothetical protein